MNIYIYIYITFNITSERMGGVLIGVFGCASVRVGVVGVWVGLG